MLQLVFGLFCIVFGSTVTFMKKEQLVYLLLKGKDYKYEGKLYKLDPFIRVMRVLCGMVALLGLYICIGCILHLVMGN